MNTDFIITSIRRVILVTKEDYADKIINFTHKNITNELIFHFSGQATVYFNGQILHTGPDSIRFLPAGKIDDYRVDRTERGDCIMFGFTADRPIIPAAFVSNSAQNNAKIAPLFRKAFLVWVAKNEGYYHETISILYKIFAELEKQNYLPPRKYDLIRPAVQYIEEHFLTDEISSQTLSRLCGISYSYINRIFCEKFGLSPKKYIISLKLNYAAALLESGDYSVSQIAAMCGFDTVYYFSRQFKSAFGISPTDYARQRKNG